MFCALERGLFQLRFTLAWDKWFWFKVLSSSSIFHLSLSLSLSLYPFLSCSEKFFRSSASNGGASIAEETSMLERQTIIIFNLSLTGSYARYEIAISRLAGSLLSLASSNASSRRYPIFKCWIQTSSSKARERERERERETGHSLSRGCRILHPRDKASARADMIDNRVPPDNKNVRPNTRCKLGASRNGEMANR